MEVVILLNKSYWKEKVKTRPYDQDDIFFLDEKSILVFFYLVSFFESEIQRNVGSEESLAMIFRVPNKM